MKLIFVHYILSPKENSLTIRFLMAQRNDPMRGDWYSDVIKIIKEFELGENEKDIRYIPVKTFKKSFNQKGKVAGIKYLQGQQSKCEKGSRIKYKFQELQDYLRPSSILSLEDQRFFSA